MANSNYTKIAIDETLREIVSHGSEDYRFKYYLEDIWMFDFHCIDWHWHPEVEFVFIEKGTAEFLIGSSNYSLSSGTGVFINSHVIHRFEAKRSVIIPNIVFSPFLLSPEESLIYNKYIRPVIESSLECLILSPDNPWQMDIISLLKQVFSVNESENPSEIATVELLLKLWNIMYTNIDLSAYDNMRRASDHTMAQLQIMMQYIHKNYKQHITLDDICERVSLSSGSVLNIFNKNLHTSPINYLINYRLKQAAKLLTNTENSVYSIAQDTGFESTGYFCRRFKKLFKKTPGDYRKSSLKH